MLAVLEHEHGRNGGNPVLGGKCLVLVDVQLNDGDLFSVLFSDLVQDRAELAAWTAPFCQKSTMTGLSDSRTSAWNVASVTALALLMRCNPFLRN